MRAAIGAGRGRLIAQFLTESLVLSPARRRYRSAAGVAGDAVSRTLTPESMGAVRLTLDWRVVAISAAAAIGSTLIYGLAPALRGRGSLLEGLREGGARHTGARSQWFQHSLIVIEVALAVVLLTCGALLLETLRHLRNTDLGVRSEKLLTFESPISRYEDFGKRVAFVDGRVGEDSRHPRRHQRRRRPRAFR